MTVRDILVKWLTANGYDGLYDEDGECACAVDDLCPCDSEVLWCQPGYKRPCDCGDHDWHIGAEKPVEKTSEEVEPSGN
jgi:hypothetical protein